MTQDLEAIAAALRSLPGIAAADVRPGEAGGVGSLRLDLVPGVDSVQIAGAASRLVSERVGAAVDATQVQVVDAGGAEPVLQLPAQRVPRRRAHRARPRRRHPGRTGAHRPGEPDAGLRTRGRAADRFGGGAGGREPSGRRATLDALNRRLEALLG